MTTHHSQLSEAFDLLTEGLIPYVEEKVKRVYRDQWEHQLRMGFKQHRMQSGQEKLVWDSHTLLTVMWDHWNACFRHQLSNTDRSLISELREARNNWAHQKDFDFDDAYRTIDSIYRLLKSTGASEHALGQLQTIKKSIIHAQSSGEIPTYQPELASDPGLPKPITELVQPLSLKQENYLRNIILYLICMIAINVQVYISWGTNGGIMMSVISLVFIMLLADQFYEWRKAARNKVAKDEAGKAENIISGIHQMVPNQTTHPLDQTSGLPESTLGVSPKHDVASLAGLKSTSQV